MNEKNLKQSHYKKRVPISVCYKKYMAWATTIDSMLIVATVWRHQVIGKQRFYFWSENKEDSKN